MLSETCLAFADANAFSQNLSAKFLLFSVILLIVRGSFSEGRFMKEALLRFNFPRMILKEKLFHSNGKVLILTAVGKH